MTPSVGLEGRILCVSVIWVRTPVTADQHAALPCWNFYGPFEAKGVRV